MQDVPSAEQKRLHDLALAERQRVLELVKRHGWNATSFQVLEPGFHYWFDGEEACVAYADTGRAWVAAGAPICAADRLAEVSARFVEAGNRAKRRVSFFSTETRFVEALPLATLRIGEQPEWDPTEWEASVKSVRSLREQLRRSRARGVTVRRIPLEELQDEQSATRRALDSLAARWLHSRAMAPMGFVVHLDLFSFLPERQCFIAELNGQVVGFLSAVPVYARDGWFLEDLLREPDAPNGTAELLIDAAMRSAAAEGKRYVTLGLAPLAGEVSPLLRFARRLGRGLYDFAGVHAFKAKLRPRTWAPIFVSHPRGQSAIATTVDVLTAFARGGLLRFGLESLARGPLFLVRVLALLLVPWTLVLALADTGRWFPSPWIHAGWVLFDVGLFFGLMALLKSWRTGLATLLATLVTADAALTTLEALLFNVPRVRGLADVLVILVAIAGPSSAAVLLWNARAHRLRET